MMVFEDISALSKKTLHEAEVISIADKENGIIRARIKQIDQTINDNDLPICVPSFNYAFFKLNPKVGERVTIMLEREYDTDKSFNQEIRYWQSLIISSPSKISYDPYFYTSSSLRPDGWSQKDVDYSTLPQAKGLIEADGTISVRGRENTDISLRDNEIIMRSGRHISSNVYTYNDENPAFVQVKSSKIAPINDEGKIIARQRSIAPEHTIKLSIVEKSVLIKVIDKKNNAIIESFSRQYESVPEMLIGAKEQVQLFKTLFPKWEFLTIDERFEDLPKIFEGSVLIENERVSEGSQSINMPSCINLAAERINLLSHKSNSFDLTNFDGQINNQVQRQVNNEAQRMVMGENLINYLSLVRQYLNSHVHPYHGLGPSKDEVLQKINAYDLETILNEFIRIN